MYYTLPPLPPELEVNILDLVNELSAEEFQFFREHYMIHFPVWLSTMTRKEAALENKTFEQFVRDACVSALMECIKKRQSSRD
jgi:hypothetical protein